MGKTVLSDTDSISLTPHSGVVFVTVLGSPQTGPRGPHMVQKKLQTGTPCGLLGRCLKKWGWKCVSVVVGNDTNRKKKFFTLACSVSHHPCPIDKETDKDKTWVLQQIKSIYSSLRLNTGICSSSTFLQYVHSSEPRLQPRDMIVLNDGDGSSASVRYELN